MLKCLRLRRVHTNFLDSCRNLKDGRDYWEHVGPVRRWLVKLFLPIPALGLHEEGSRLLKALHWLEAHSAKSPLTQSVICGYHRMVYNGLPHQAGEFRKRELVMEGMRPAAAARIPVMMKQLEVRVCAVQRNLDSVRSPDMESLLKFAVETYLRIGVLHPFDDANGRVARLAMNHLMRRYSRSYVIFPSITKDSPLWEALLKAAKGTHEELIGYARACLHQV